MNPEVPKFSASGKEVKKTREEAERRGEDPDEAEEKLKDKMKQATEKSRLNYQEKKKKEMKKVIEGKENATDEDNKRNKKAA